MATAAKDYYRLLGLTSDADSAAIERAYQELMMQLDEEEQLTGTSDELDGFRREVSEAYEVLRTPSRREAYDELRQEAAWWSDVDDADFGPPLEADELPPDPESFLESVLRRFLMSHAERDVLELLLPFEVAALGGNARLRVPMRAACDGCGGIGARRGSALPCPACGGAVLRSEDCKTCDGRGWLVTHPCTRCGGDGWNAAFGTFRLSIPPGTEDGTLLPFPGFGDSESSGATDGPDFVRVKVSNHPFFRRQGIDVHCRIPVSERAAREGSTIHVRTLRGRRKRIVIPPNTPNGTVMRLEGEGIDDSGERGDQLVEIHVMMRPRSKPGGVS